MSVPHRARGRVTRISWGKGREGRFRVKLRKESPLCLYFHWGPQDIPPIPLLGCLGKGTSGILFLIHQHCEQMPANSVSRNKRNKWMPLWEIKIWILSPKAKPFDVLLKGAESNWSLVPFCRFQPNYQTYLKTQEMSYKWEMGRLTIWPFLLSPTRHSFLFLLPMDIILITFKEVLGKRRLRESRGQCNNCP